MDCQGVIFSTQQSQKRIQKALKVLPSKVLNRILSFALYILGARLSTIGSLMEIPEESVKTMVSRVMKDGLPAFRDRRQSTETFQAETAPIALKENQAYVTMEKNYCEICFENSNNRLKIRKSHPVRLKTVLLSLLQAKLLSANAVAAVLDITPAHCRELGNRLIDHDVDDVLIDKRKGQKQDFRVNQEIKAELIQNFAARIISGYSTSSEALTEVINEHQETSISSRTIRWHMNKLGLMKIKKTLPDLVKTLKKKS